MIRRASYRRDRSPIIRLVLRELWPFKQRSFPGGRFSHREINQRLRQREVFVKISKKGSVCGFIMIMAKGNVLFIDMLAVDRTFQGRGIGKSLMQVAERYAVRKKMTHIRLFVDEMNWQAMQFYALMGYANISYVKEIKCYVFEKSL